MQSSVTRITESNEVITFDERRFALRVRDVHDDVGCLRGEEKCYQVTRSPQRLRNNTYERAATRPCSGKLQHHANYERDDACKKQTRMGLLEAINLIDLEDMLRHLSQSLVVVVNRSDLSDSNAANSIFEFSLKPDLLAAC